MQNNLTLYHSLSETLATETLLDDKQKEYYLFAKEPSDVLRDISLVNKQRIREGNELLIQFDVINLYFYL